MTTIAHEVARYGGRLYRSTIEARWAVFFDTARIPFEYEPRVVDLGWCRYLPDFWLPGLGCWVEIKGAYPTDAERRKAADLARLTGQHVFVCWGLLDPEWPILRFHAGTGEEAVGFAWQEADFQASLRADRGVIGPLLKVAFARAAAYQRPIPSMADLLQARAWEGGHPETRYKRTPA